MLTATAIAAVLLGNDGEQRVRVTPPGSPTPYDDPDITSGQG